MAADAATYIAFTAATRVAAAADAARAVHISIDSCFFDRMNGEPAVGIGPAIAAGMSVGTRFRGGVNASCGASCRATTGGAACADTPARAGANRRADAGIRAG